MGTMAVWEHKMEIISYYNDCHTGKTTHMKTRTCGAFFWALNSRNS